MSIIEMKVPTIGESITEVTLSQWLKGDGEFVKIDEPICEFESDKATLEFPAEASGKLTYVAAEGDDLEIGALVAKIDTSVSGGGAEEAKAPAAEKVEEKAAIAAPSSNDKKDVASPAAAKIMRENNLTANDVAGSGKDGRITKHDAQQAAEKTPAAKPAAKASPTVSTPIVAGARNIRREKMSRMRRTIASRLVSAKNNTAMLTTFNEVDLTEIMKLRKAYQENLLQNME